MCISQKGLEIDDLPARAIASIEALLHSAAYFAAFFAGFFPVLMYLLRHSGDPNLSALPAGFFAAALLAGVFFVAMCV